MRLAEPIVQPLPARLNVLIQPPVSPSQRQWRVRLYRPGIRMSEIVKAAEGLAGADGTWSATELPPATYVLRVLDEDESEVAQQAVTLHGGPEQVLVTVSATEVRGMVLSGDDGVAAQIEFDFDGRRVKAASDDHGDFTAHFPTSGLWCPIVSLSGGAKLRLSPRKLPASDVVLRIPAGGVKGRVLDADARGTRAMITAMRDGRVSAQIVTADDGTFELRGLEGGKYALEAEAEEASSGAVDVSVSDSSNPEVVLRLGRLNEVRGIVLTPTASPASGAVVRVFDPVVGRFEDMIADGRGMFTFKTRPHAESIGVIVIDPPYPIAARRLPVGTRNEPVTIQLVAVGAKLRLVQLRTPPWPTIVMAGASYSLGLFIAPSFGGGGRRELVNGAFEFLIEPGAYVVCSEMQECRSVQLPPNAEALIDFASGREAEKR